MSELLAPAGDFETAKTAIMAGADAVYLGLKQFSARAVAENFDLTALSEIARFAHLLGAKVYVCCNTLVKDGETSDFVAGVLNAYNAGADAVLVQDIFLGAEIKKRFPQIELHLSTQGGCCNEYGAKVARDFGFSRVVLARETALEDIRKIAKIIDTEVFVQGALCACFSGQCYFSSFAGNMSGNRGRCKQPCRKKYSIDREGFGEPAYALSPSDLSLGKRVKELEEAGVCSFKIEGRMRRSEYVAAAVEYYRSVLGGKADAEAFTRLKRAYNRGDYTEGIAFGEKNFLSRNVQGHIGERVGEVTIVKGRPFCRTAYRAHSGDGFKILRGNAEAGGAGVLRVERDGFFLSTTAKLLAGDGVYVTTDTAANARSLQVGRARKISITVSILPEEYPEVRCGDFVFTGAERALRARNAPLQAEDAEICFQKTDALPFDAKVEAITRDAFLPKSALNALRRAFYAALADAFDPPRERLSGGLGEIKIQPVKGNAVAAISVNGRTGADVEIIKNAENKGTMSETAQRFLYLPPFLTGAEIERIERAVGNFDGIYCEGTYGIALAQKFRKPLFAGTGFNLSNAYAVSGVRSAGAKYYALSKELSAEEQRALSGEGAFALSAGDLKLMDLVFCPFGRTCAACDKRDVYTMTDEAGRMFALRRYGQVKKCAFELYNCLPISSANGLSSALADCTLTGGTAEAALRGGVPATAGHKNRSVL